MCVGEQLHHFHYTQRECQPYFWNEQTHTHTPTDRHIHRRILFYCQQVILYHMEDEKNEKRKIIWGFVWNVCMCAIQNKMYIIANERGLQSKANLGTLFVKLDKPRMFACISKLLIYIFYFFLTLWYVRQWQYDY